MRRLTTVLAIAAMAASPAFAAGSQVAEEATYGRFMEACGTDEWKYVSIDERWLNGPMPTGNRCGEAVYAGFHEGLKGKLDEASINKCASETSVGEIDMAIDFSPVSTSDLYERHALEVLRDVAPYVCGLAKPVAH